MQGIGGPVKKRRARKRKQVTIREAMKYGAELSSGAYDPDEDTFADQCVQVLRERILSLLTPPKRPL